MQENSENAVPAEQIERDSTIATIQIQLFDLKNQVNALVLSAVEALQALEKPAADEK